jgi:regulator of RNase E activity RraA
MSASPDETIGIAPWILPVRGPSYKRATPSLLDDLREVSAATACARLNALGISRSFVAGPTPLRPGKRIVGSAVTLQFMPQREDVASGVTQEYIERKTALWHVLETIEERDVLVVQAYGSLHTGALGEMLVRYFKKRGGTGIVLDGRIRDTQRVRELDVPLWCVGSTPHFASQTDLFPWAFDVPVAVGGALCLPGDVVIADDDGAVVVPQGVAQSLVTDAQAHEDWESFSRQRIEDGGALKDYYPLTDETRTEYELWKAGR